MRRSLGCVLAVLVAGPSTAQAQAETWTVDPVPAIEIGASPDDPNDQLGLVIDVARLADGAIAILDGFIPAVRVYDASGRHMRDIGRRGDGPGEFQDAVALEGMGDTIVVLDRIGRRTWFDVDGSLLRTDRLVIEPLCGERFNARYGGLLPDATLLVRCEERLFGRVKGEYRQTVGLLRQRLSGAVDTLGWFPADTGRTDPSGVPVPRPYVPRQLLLWAASGATVYVAPSHKARVEVLTLDGTARAALHPPLSPRPVSAADIEHAMGDMLRLVGNDNDRRVVREWVTAMPRADLTPTVRSLLVTDDRVWIETWERRGDAWWWLVVDANGAPLARVLGPPATTVVAVGSEWVLGLWRDGLGVEHVRLHTLRRP